MQNTLKIIFKLFKNKMQNTLKIIFKLFKFFPYHLVPTSPWPLLVSFSLLSLTLLAVMYMQGFPNGGNFLSLGFTITTLGLFGKAFSGAALLKISFIAFFIFITLILIYLEYKDKNSSNSNNIEFKQSGVKLPKSLKDALFKVGPALTAYHGLLLHYSQNKEEKAINAELNKARKSIEESRVTIEGLTAENLANKAKLANFKGETSLIIDQSSRHLSSLAECQKLLIEIEKLKKLQNEGATLSLKELNLIAREEEVLSDLNYYIKEVTRGADTITKKVEILSIETSAFPDTSNSVSPSTTSGSSAVSAPSTTSGSSAPSTTSASSAPSGPKAQSNILPINFDYDNFMKGLNKLELLSFGNLLLDSLILNATISIIFNLYGDYLIQKFNLEIKYPKLAKFIKLRKKLQKYSIVTNFILIFIGLIPQIFMCIFILLPKILELFE